MRKSNSQSIFKYVKIYPIFLLILIGNVAFYSCDSEELGTVTGDEINSKVMANSPVSIELGLDKNQVEELKAGQLGLVGQSNNEHRVLAALQLAGSNNNSVSHAVTILPKEIASLSEFKIIDTDSSLKPIMQASKDPESGQIMIQENEQKILQYNYQTVFKKDVVRLPGEKKAQPNIAPIGGVYLKTYLEEHPTAKRDSLYTTKVYAVPRSDYIHPLYGLDGEMLTKDWPADGEFHHRGIFWAWPDVEFGTKRGDLYALQRVFARPTGKIELKSGPVFAQIEAENLWMWEDEEPIVREHATIRIYRKKSDSRIVDLALKFVTLKDSITIATRNTDSYGGLNLRFQTPDSQDISYFTANPKSNPQRAWSDLSGKFATADTTSGLTTLQHKKNPEFPGEWVEYPDLSWVQPTFPTPDTRYPLSKKDSLVLRYRLIIHKGGKSDKKSLRKRWDAFNNEASPLLP